MLVLDIDRHPHGVDEVDSKRQNVGVVDGVHNGVCVELVPECLGRRSHRGVAAHSGIDRENRRAGEAEDVVVLEGFGDFRVHGSELRTMAFVENQDHMLCVCGMGFIFADEDIELLNCCNDNAHVWIFNLFLQDFRRRVTVGCAFLKTVIFTHRLIVEVFSIDDENDLVDIGECRGELGCLKTGQGFAGACRVPDVSAGGGGAGLLVVGRNLDAAQDLLRGSDLIRAHDQQEVFRGKNTVARQYVQHGVLGEKSLSKIDQIRYRPVACIRPIACKFKTVAGFFLRFLGISHGFADVLVSRGIRIILGVRAVGYDKQLHIFEKAGIRPETITLVSTDLVKSLAQGDAASLELNMHQWQAID